MVHSIGELWTVECARQAPKGEGMDTEVDASTNQLARELTRYLITNHHVVQNALGNHLRHMKEAAAEAAEAYEAGQRDPKVKAAQNASLMTNNGLKTSAQMFREDAAKTEAVMVRLQELVESAEDAEVWP